MRYPVSCVPISCRISLYDRDFPLRKLPSYIYVHQLDVIHSYDGNFSSKTVPEINLDPYCKMGIDAGIVLEGKQQIF